MPRAGSGQVDGGRILTETFRRIRRERASSWEELNLHDLSLSSPYVIVELTDGSQGVALNLEHEHPLFRPDGARSKGAGRTGPGQAEEWLHRSRRDPLLADTLLADASPTTPRAIAIQVAILNALSQLLNGNVEYLRGRGLTAPQPPEPLAELTRKGDEVAVVGFRQLDFRQALYDPKVRRVRVSDPSWGPFSEMRPLAARYLDHFGSKVEFHDSGEGEAIVAEADVCILAASTLCAGTMDGLLGAARRGRCREVIVRGHGAGILSDVLFDHGVTLHVVSRPRRGFLAEARSFMAKLETRDVLPVLSQVRTVLEEDDFHDFIDLRIEAFTIRERPLSLATLGRRWRRRLKGGRWGTAPGRGMPGVQGGGRDHVLPQA